MRDVLLNYVMDVEAIAPLPAASSAYIRKVLCVVKPLVGIDPEITECTSKSQVENKTQSLCWKMLDAGMTSIYILPTESLNIADILQETDKKFFTILIDGAFETVEDFDQGTFEGVVGWTNGDRNTVKNFAWLKNNVGFYDIPANQSENMYNAFGKLLSGRDWTNQQYIEMPKGSGINTINDANLLFEDSISFVLTSEEYSHRLALFASNRRAIVAPYLYEEITLKLQSKALQYIQLNQPAYTPLEASLLEDSLQGVIDLYVERGYITRGAVTVELTDQNFVVNADIYVAEPKALWRIFAKMQQGDI